VEEVADRRRGGPRRRGAPVRCGCVGRAMGRGLGFWGPGGLYSPGAAHSTVGLGWALGEVVDRSRWVGLGRCEPLRRGWTRVGYWASWQHMGRVVPFDLCCAGLALWAEVAAQHSPMSCLCQPRPEIIVLGPVLISGQKFVLWVGLWASCFLAIYKYNFHYLYSIMLDFLSGSQKKILLLCVPKVRVTLPLY
jgi:hypothetical protein